jgi:hypothetical protein
MKRDRHPVSSEELTAKSSGYDLSFCCLFDVASPKPALCLDGRSCGAGGKFGSTTKGEMGPPQSKLTFIYGEKGRVANILAFPGSDCQTGKDIKIGDSEEKVHKVYGDGKKTHPKFKGDPWGDFALDYPGVQFVIIKRKVAVMAVGGFETN